MKPAASDDRKTVLTWSGTDGSTRLEQARVQVSGSRVKAYGQIVSAAGEHPAFNVNYDFVTDDAGVTRRLAVHLIRESGESHVSITRDGESTWLIQTAQGTERGDFGGAQDVDLVLSPLFNAMPIRRLQLHRTASDAVDVPLVYLRLPEGTVEPVVTRYSSDDSGVSVQSPVGNVTLTTDSAGFVVDYPGLATRV
ncbi:putative glycolipid-binding domain-containing protein [Williamsia deligens]|uniref:Glycolipid-binding domain-containing protein n=1 Tax=Williamsia deligens TaxID=321325 RepID=A0ABW3G7Z4_9NOCA